LSIIFYYLLIKRRKGEEMDLLLRVRVDVRKKPRKMLKRRGKREKNRPNSLGQRRFPN
jgi:hypothetical protein